jgi:hypothetical protein
MALRICLIYVFPTAFAATYVPMAKRFIRSYLQNPPGEADHEIHVAINGGREIGDWCQQLFFPLPCKFFQHNNVGKDIGAFQTAADLIECDLMICMGSPVHFHKPGWLDQIVRAYEEYGPTVWGAWGFQAPRPHLRTTCFWLPPELLNSYPRRIDDSNRYEFEHGASSIALWAKSVGFQPLMLTWKGVYQMEAWDNISREDSLFVDQHLAGER